jgi:alkaline phosphatase D
MSGRSSHTGLVSLAITTVLCLAALIPRAPAPRADINQDEQVERQPDTPAVDDSGNPAVTSVTGADLPAVQSPLQITHGIACGDVTAHGAVIWARCNAEGQMRVQCSRDPAYLESVIDLADVPALGGEDNTASVRLRNLTPGSLYHYRVWFMNQPETEETVLSYANEGTFTTPPDSSTSAPVRFVWGHGLGGDGHCRLEGHGYGIFTRMADLEPDFFVALGSMIYAEDECRAKVSEGKSTWENIPGGFSSVSAPEVAWEQLSQTRHIFWQHWRYTRADEHLRHLLSRTCFYGQWDDGEVLRDFGGSWDYWNAENRDRQGYPLLVLEGRDAFLEYTPIARDPQEVNRIYRSFHRGKDLDLFLLDVRSYRSRNDEPDTPDNHKTMLGTRQLEWLRQGLLHSTATWKVVSCGVPLSVPIGDPQHGRDGWAAGDETDTSGFERELLDLLGSLDRGHVRNLVFLTAGANWAAQIRYEQDLDGDGQPLLFHELLVGPLSARPSEPTAVDATLAPLLLYDEGGFFNFGSANITRQADGKVHLLAEVRGEDGKARPGSSLDLVAQ